MQSPWRNPPSPRVNQVGKNAHIGSLGPAYILQGQIYIADIGKALGAQQLLDDLRRYAGERIPFEADRGNFRRGLGGERFSATAGLIPPSPQKPAAPATAALVTKRRLPCVIAIRSLQSPHVQTFSSRFSSLRKRQSVCSAISIFGLDLIMPASCIRSP